MAGIAILLDLWRKNQNFGSGLHSPQPFQSSAFFSASAAVGAAASFAAGTGFASRAFFGSPVAYCDAGAAVSEDYISGLQSASKGIYNNDGSLRYSTTKHYNVELKPLFSAFEFRPLMMTSLRSFLMFYLPLLEPRAEMEDDDFLEEREEQPTDLVVPFKKSVKQIIRETTVVMTRRILERIAVHYVSERMAWKILKDVPKSASRKAARNMPYHVYFFCVSRTTFRGHMLGVAASWIVQVGIDMYRFFKSIFKSPDDEGNNVDKSEQVAILGQRIFVATVRCSSSLIFASIGAGIGAILIRPSLGQWIGCAAGDLAGPVIVTYFADQLFQVKFC
ncbi:uncharacterized protein [Arachis hypogaea]|uniref:Uncharacterized protein n=1 Tax=Arachis hypogaea TaxID=3818 RepID=A0A444YUW2_ARAHY|nr:uncharacterized protein LOC112697453 [Arachis hypogaea]XP_025606421.1 uncharacterized protein LOC112697453 [Arachis hypogaea]QHN87789.1 uncharacterized protein DS421_16g558110 [Arachis hypogaea]RYR05688.1 hypothetical protein Ahy_B06g085520 [Arachis hypogaea]